jgi:predicted AAA+ superfamily ATPase
MIHRNAKETIQTLVDKDHRMGLFILTGSQQFGLMSGITQSLAERTAFVELLPFSVQELALADKLPVTIDAIMLIGCYPPIYDRGLVSWLLGIRTTEQMITHPLLGSIFETFIISELIKSKLNKGEKPAFSFWRDRNGNEVDLCRR